MMRTAGLGRDKRRSNEANDCKAVVSALYLHAVDQLSRKEQVQAHILPNGGRS